VARRVGLIVTKKMAAKFKMAVKKFSKNFQKFSKSFQKFSKSFQKFSKIFQKNFQKISIFFQKFQKLIRYIPRKIYQRKKLPRKPNIRKGALSPHADRPDGDYEAIHPTFSLKNV
jgi:DNA anti-recombination protein RmuC